MVKRGGGRQGKSTHADYTGRELAAGSRLHPCTCYIRLSPLVQSHINTKQSSDPSTPGKDKKKNTKKQRRERMAGRGRSQNTMEHLPLTLIYRRGDVSPEDTLCFLELTRPTTAQAVNFYALGKNDYEILQPSWVPGDPKNTRSSGSLLASCDSGTEGAKEIESWDICSRQETSQV